MEDKIIAISILIILTTIGGYFKKSARDKLYELFTTKAWIINFIVIMCFVAYTHFIELPNIKNNEKREKIAESIKRGLIALLIAMMAELKLSIAPFWIIFVFSYYMHGWM